MIFLQDKTHMPIKPIKASEISSKIKGGFAVIEQKRDLAVSEIALDTIGGVKKGTKVYLRPDSGFATFNREIFTMGSVEFVLAPIDYVLGLEE